MSESARRNSSVATALAACLALATMGCGGAAPESVPVTFLDYSASVPATWAPREPSSTMRLAEYVIPGARGDSVQVVVYFFGEGQGGSSGANIARWASQFSGPGGERVEPGVEELVETRFHTTMVTLEGTYARSIGMGGQGAEPLPDQRLEAAVVETPRGNLYIQMFGPREAVAGHSAAYRAFVRGIGEG